MIRAMTQDAQDKAYFNGKHSLCLMALVVLRSCGHVKLIFDEQAISLDLSIGNFGFAPRKRRSSDGYHLTRLYRPTQRGGCKVATGAVPHY